MCHNFMHKALFLCSHTIQNTICHTLILKSQSSVNFRLPCCDKFSTNSAHQTNRCPNVLTYQGKV